MCIIIDACKIGEFYKSPPSEDTTPIHNWLDKGGAIAYSATGKAGEEFKTVLPQLLDYNQKGQSFPVDAEQIMLKQALLENHGTCKSNDTHILALAQVSGARLLYTNDENLMNDFKNPTIINKPRGKIYSNSTNKHLLKPGICKRTSR